MQQCAHGRWRASGRAAPLRYLFDRASLLLLVEDGKAGMRLVSLQEAYRLLVRDAKPAMCACAKHCLSKVGVGGEQFCRRH